MKDLHTVQIIFVLLVISSVSAHAQRSSPFEPPEESDTTFITDLDSGLDTGCTFRGHGPLIIKTKIDRYVGEVNRDGYLKDIDTLIVNKVISAKAKVRLPVYDIDTNNRPENTQPEHDRITFNGEDLGLLSGGNGIWKYNEFEVDIRTIKFPSRGLNGIKPTPAENEIRIYIDESNASESWCMAVDWVAISFDTIAPILLIHGTNAQSDTWDPIFTTALNTRRILFSNDINMERNGSSEQNARILKKRINGLAKSFGAQSVHLVSHSKGGVDSRRFFSAHYTPNPSGGEPKVLSLTTINTPHHGTILSDLSVKHRTVNDLDSNNPDIEEFFKIDGLLSFSGEGPSGAALLQQTTNNMVEFNSNNPFPSGIKFYTIGSDADIDNNGAITSAEASPLVRISAANIGSIMYRILGNGKKYTIARHTNFSGLNEYHTLTPVNTGSFQKNDLVVTEQSAQHKSGSRILFVDENHSGIKNAGTLQAILNRITRDFPLHF